MFCDGEQGSEQVHKNLEDGHRLNSKAIAVAEDNAGNGSAYPEKSEAGLVIEFQEKLLATFMDQGLFHLSSLSASCPSSKEFKGTYMGAVPPTGDSPRMSNQPVLT